MRTGRSGLAAIARASPPPRPAPPATRTGRAGSHTWGMSTSHPSLAQSGSGSAPPPSFPTGFQLLGEGAATKGLNEAGVGLVSRKPPGDPVSPQTSIFPRRPTRGRWGSRARAAAGAAGRSQAASPFPAGTASPAAVPGTALSARAAPAVAATSSRGRRHRPRRSSARPPRPLHPVPSRRGLAAQQPAPPPGQL